ncbi:hypothetical protein CTAYLR_006483 [Chrysophaeum taylorii]|uniref:tRNA (guanine(46)-N(7))-methyltransferase n=1 Tax=Chrysophaeum taylorii TaxID=2483200 RepID=A0AAD7ULC8_9STRA|nr:hypothetical protein CTAYLR_006483 [Chrysophaeum taylorii]
MVAPSYLRRRGQATKAQKRALRELWPTYGIDLATRSHVNARAPLNCTRTFGRDAPLILDVGHGHGESIVALSRTFPTCNILGCEVHVPSIGATLLRLDEEGLPNVKLVRADVFELLTTYVGVVSACFCGFPDPFPGASPSSLARKLIRPAFADLVAARYVPFAETLPPVSIATDDGAYAAHARVVFDKAGWTELEVTNRPEQRPPWRPISKYERKAIDASRVVWDLGFAPSYVRRHSLIPHPDCR